MISYLSTAMVLCGVAIQLAALAPARRLIGLIPAGSLRNKWYAMTALMVIFIAGYLGYVVVLLGATDRVARPAHSRTVCFRRHLCVANDQAFSANRR